MSAYVSSEPEFSPYKNTPFALFSFFFTRLYLYLLFICTPVSRRLLAGLIKIKSAVIFLSCTAYRGTHSVSVCSVCVVLCRSLQTIFRVKGFTELWWLWTRPLTLMPWPKPWGSPATNTCCIGTCMRRWNHSLCLTGRFKSPLSYSSYTPTFWLLIMWFCSVL